MFFQRNKVIFSRGLINEGQGVRLRRNDDLFDLFFRPVSSEYHHPTVIANTLNEGKGFE